MVGMKKRSKTKRFEEDFEEEQGRREEKNDKRRPVIEPKQIAVFVKKTLEKGPKGLKEEFAGMKRTDDLEKMEVFLDNGSKGRNRYNDIGCLDASRVKLKGCGENDYIHANYVSSAVSENRFICAQAPLEKTCQEFWAMVKQEKVENIVMLCSNVEKGENKCHEYYPTTDGSKIIFGDYTVKCKGQKTFKFKCDTNAYIKETVLQVKQGGKKQTVSHYHWIDWPDRGVPPADMAVIELIEKIKSSKLPILVHCSADIGRTGSVVLIQSIIEALETGQALEDCAGILKKIRQQRSKAVQTVSQYIFVHQVMLNYFVENNLLGDSEKAAVSNFIKQCIGK